jgi:CPA2 family monovalent cation:H+ antiporter-2
VAVGPAVFIGFLVSLSSTAIVLRLFQERAEIESPQGQTSLAILIFQDLAVVPMMLLTPFLAGGTGQTQESVLILEFKGLALVVLLLVSAKWIVPLILDQIARTRNRELFRLSTLTLCFIVGYLTHTLGLSLALGAFYAGLIVSETEFSHETLGNIIPFRDVFTGLFFVSIGMLLDVEFLVQHPHQVALIAVTVIVLKSVTAGFVVLLLGMPFRTALLVGLALCQVGEFSFIMFMKWAEFGLLEPTFYQFFLNVSVLTMGITPFIIVVAPTFADTLLKLPIPVRLRAGFSTAYKMKRRHRLKDHLIIVGFGVNGRNIARAAKLAGVPYVIIEMNPQTVKTEREKGEPIYYGDASQTAVLEQADIKEARVLVVVISDLIATRRMTVAARQENSRLLIVVRTRFVTEVKQLFDLGADEVIPEEFETSIEIFSRVLTKYLIPRDEIRKIINEARADGYQMFRTFSKESTDFSDMKLHLPDVDITTIRVQENSSMAGRSVGEIELRRKHGVTLLAVSRNQEVVSNPGADMIIQPGDLLVLLGSLADLRAVCTRLLDPSFGETHGCDIPDSNTGRSES